MAADAPALTELGLKCCRLGDAALGLLCDALPGNNHLRNLDLEDNDISAAFALQRLLPAVRANTSLRELRADEPNNEDEDEDKDAAVGEAMQLVEARAAAEAAAA